MYIMYQILTKYIPPATVLFDFIRKPKPERRQFNIKDLDEISRKIMFETVTEASRLLSDMYDAPVEFYGIEGSRDSYDVHINGTHAFSIWGKPLVHPIPGEV